MILWLVGDPGVGKTSLVRQLLAQQELVWVSKPNWTVAVRDRIVAAGHYTGETFDGADTVPYNGVEDALDFWLDNYSSYKLTIFDGDRFSHTKAVDFFRLRTPEAKLVCVHMIATPEVIEAQRKARGSKQNVTWLKGRSTKVRNFFDAFPSDNRYQLEARAGSPSAVAALLLKTLEEAP